MATRYSMKNGASWMPATEAFRNGEKVEVIGTQDLGHFLWLNAASRNSSVEVTVYYEGLSRDPARLEDPIFSVYKD